VYLLSFLSHLRESYMHQSFNPDKCLFGFFFFFLQLLGFELRVRQVFYYLNHIPAFFALGNF
jgi:hypothetical protein